MVTEATDDTLQMLNDIAGRVADQTPVLQAVSEDFYQRQRQWFASHGAGTWTPRSSVTDRLHGGELMNVTGELLASFTSAGHQWAISETSNDTVRVGSRAPHAHLQHDGTPRGKVPSRPLMNPDVRELLNAWTQMELDHINDDQIQIGG